MEQPHSSTFHVRFKPGLALLQQWSAEQSFHCALILLPPCIAKQARNLRLVEFIAGIVVSQSHSSNSGRLASLLARHINYHYTQRLAGHLSINHYLTLFLTYPALRATTGEIFSQNMDI